MAELDAEMPQGELSLSYYWRKTENWNRNKVHKFAFLGHEPGFRRHLLGALPLNVWETIDSKVNFTLQLLLPCGVEANLTEQIESGEAWGNQ